MFSMMSSRIFGASAEAEAAAPEAAAGAAATEIESPVASPPEQATEAPAAPVAAPVEAPVKQTVTKQTVIKQTVSLSGGLPYMAQYSSSAEAPAPVEYAPATYTTIANTSIADESTILQGNTTYEHSSLSYQPNDLETSTREQSTFVASSVQPLYTMKSLDQTVSSAVPIYSRHDLGQVGAMPQIVKVSMPMNGEALQMDQLAKVFPLGAPEHLVRSMSLESLEKEGKVSGSVSVAPVSPVVTKYPLAAMKQSPPVVLTSGAPPTGVSLPISPQKPEPQEAAAKPEPELPQKVPTGKKAKKSSKTKVVTKKTNKGVCPC